MANSASASQRTASNEASHSSSSSSSARLRLAFFVLGIGALLPFNALLNVLDFYTLRYPSISVAHYVTNVYTLSFTLFATLLTLFPPSSRLRTALVLLCYLLMTLISIAYPLLSNATFALPLILTFVLGMVNAADESLLFGILALLHDKHFACTTMYTAGFATVLLVALRVATRVFFELGGLAGLHRLQDGGKPIVNVVTSQMLKPGFVLFFCTCATLCALCALVVVWMYTMSDEYAQHVLINESSNDASSSSSALSPLPTLILNSNSTHPSSDNNRTPLLGRVSKNHVSILPSPYLSASTPTSPPPSLFSIIRADALSIFFCFLVTLTLFPGIMTQLPRALACSQRISATLASWYPLIIVGSFAVGDVLGRISWAANFARAFPKKLPVIVCARTVLVPVVTWLWTRPKGTSLKMTIGTTFVTGLSNGFAMNVAYLVAPSRVCEREMKERTGKLMFLANSWGLFAGAVSGALLQISMLRPASM